MSHGSTRAGHVAIIGTPNAGKSTLLNRLLGSKLSIVTSAAQTTRQRVVGIDTRPDAQIVYMDTPGLVDPAHLLHRSMLTTVEQATSDADVVILLLDGSRTPPDLAPEAAAILAGLSSDLVVAINKSDVANPTGREQLTEWSRQRFEREPLLLSARTGAGVDELRELIVERLPESPFLYPEDEISTQTVRFFVEELIRETIFERYAEEIPYSATVKVEEFRESDDPLYIGATIFVERSSQKGILIGKGGSAIRELGANARAKVEQFLERRVYLALWVKVLPKWRKDPLELQRLGFPVPPDALNRRA